MAKKKIEWTNWDYYFEISDELFYYENVMRLLSLYCE
jgi:hypothetical protein